MRFSIVFFALLVPGFIACQTLEKEKAHLVELAQQGVITNEEYREKANSLLEFVEEIGGYPQLPINEDGDIVFDFVLNTHYDTKTNFNRILEWAAIRFGDLQSVLRYQNLETGRIILKGNFDVVFKKDYKTFWGKKKEEIEETTAYQTFDFFIKDNKVRMRILDLRYKFKIIAYAASTMQYSQREIEVGINTLMPITQADIITWKGNLSMIGETTNNILSYRSELENYINAYEMDYKF